jgi:hypothetical protein
MYEMCRFFCIYSTETVSRSTTTREKYEFKSLTSRRSFQNWPWRQKMPDSRKIWPDSTCFAYDIDIRHRLHPWWLAADVIQHTVHLFNFTKDRMYSMTKENQSLSQVSLTQSRHAMATDFPTRGLKTNCKLLSYTTGFIKINENTRRTTTRSSAVRKCLSTF